MATSIDVIGDDLIALRDVPKYLPGRPHHLTVVRWARVGLRGVRLETVLVNNIRYTTQDCINEFFRSTSQETPRLTGLAGKGADDYPATPRRKQRRVKEAAKRAVKKARRS